LTGEAFLCIFDAMAGRAPWQDGRRAWNRLNGWHRWSPQPSSPTSPNLHRIEEALEALSDIRLVRGLLDEAEAGAVRAARLASSTWSEIGAKLGTSRQAAWEKWHDLDGSSAGD
jgi:hypothetical protein